MMNRKTFCLMFFVITACFPLRVHAVTICVKKWFDNQSPTTQCTTTSASTFTIHVNTHVDAVSFSVTDPVNDSLPLIYIERNDSSTQLIWLYAVTGDANAVPGNAHYQLQDAAAKNWNGLQIPTGNGQFSLRAVINGNLTGSVLMGDADHTRGVQNFRAGGQILATILSGSIGACRVQAATGIGGTVPNQFIESAAGVLAVLVDSGNLLANVRALNGAIGQINVSSGDIGNPAPAAITFQITATNGIGALNAGGAVSANITGGGSIQSLDVGLDYRGTMTLSGFDAFRIRRDLLADGVINLTSALPADRVLEIDRSTIAGSQIYLPTSTGLLGQIDINRANGGGSWGGTVTVGSTELTVPGYTNTASSLGGGSVGHVPFGLHDESCAPVNGSVVLTACCVETVGVRLRHYGPLLWTTGLPATVWRRPACTTDTFVDVTPSAGDFALEDDNPSATEPLRTLVVTIDIEPNYEYKITPTSNLKCAGVTTGEPPVVWDSDYTFTVKPACYADIDASGTVGTADLLAVIAAWGACPTPPTACPTDVGPLPCPDGTVGTADLLAVIGTWGPCPVCDEGGDDESEESSMMGSSMNGSGSGSGIGEIDWDHFIDCLDNGTPEEQADCLAALHALLDP